MKKLGGWLALTLCTVAASAQVARALDVVTTNTTMPSNSCSDVKCVNGKVYVTISYLGKTGSYATTLACPAAAKPITSATGAPGRPAVRKAPGFAAGKNLNAEECAAQKGTWDPKLKSVEETITKQFGVCHYVDPLGRRCCDNCDFSSTGYDGKDCVIGQCPCAR